ncbi:MAG: septal ring lytic transglycosylase RlpA family protein, partial [Desulfobulbia bacterium]
FVLLSSFDSEAFTQKGKASYYWQPQKLASGGYFNPQAMTAAHKTLPFGSKVRVTHTSTGRSVVVTINDRGPYIKGRIIDLSLKAATSIGMRKAGVVPVKIEVIGKSSYKSLAKKSKGKSKKTETAAKKSNKPSKKKKIAKKKSKASNKKTASAKSSGKKKQSQSGKTKQTVQKAPPQSVIQPTTNTALDIEQLIHNT